MEAKLIKDHQEYMLINDKRFVIATTAVSILEVTDKMKLSKQNCDEIFGVVDVDKWVKEKVDNRFNENDGYHKVVFVEGLVEGFNKAMELNKDKVFTLEDVKRAIDKAKQGSVKETHNGYGRPTEPRFVLDDLSYDEIIQSLNQPTEIEVEIEMDSIPADRAPNGWDTFPKLDSSGCIILKKI